MSRSQRPVAAATRALFARYREVIAQPGPDPMAEDRYLSLANLDWMCRQAIAEADELPLDKISRWLGFVQGCLAMRGLLDVDAERDISRPLFHTAYREAGIDVPGRRERP